jgi:hypothetical protein
MHVKCSGRGGGFGAKTTWIKENLKKILMNINRKT